MGKAKKKETIRVKKKRCFYADFNYICISNLYCADQFL